MTLHKEGKYIIPVSLLICMGVCGLAVVQFTHPMAIVALCLPFLIVLGLIINFFRSPAIVSPVGDNLILAPCDGKVVVIEEVTNPEGMTGAYRQVSIFMSPLNVHVNRMPWGGVIRRLEYRPGKYLVAWNPKSSTENEQTFLIVEHKGIQIGFKQIAGALARRIRWYVKEGDQLKAGAEFGFIRFGSRMDVLIPDSAGIEVSLGQTVQGGVSIIARF